MPRTFIVALAMLCVGLCGRSHAADPLILQLKWLADAQSAGFFVAQDKGLYRQAGLDVTIHPGGPDIAPSEVLATGKADVAVDWMPSALAAREKGAPIVNIAQMFQHSGLQLTCRRDSGVHRPADFKGKRLAVWFAGNEFPFLAWMAKLGYRTAGPNPDVTVLRQGAGVELLTEKQADCISTMTYNEYGQLLDAGMRPSELVVFHYDDLGVAALEDGLYVLQPALDDPAKVDRLARFLRASVAGWRYALVPAHEAETVAIVLRNASPGMTDAPHQQRMLGEVDKLVPGGHHGLGYLDPAAYQRTVDVLMSGGGDPVIRQKPEGAWTHAVWDKAFPRQSAGSSDRPSAATPAAR
ncbi:MAG: ABC transporter substrate-binding protein [Alphaproteobacteria bacterium]|nr:ABC transporter substrate-binding protein [Alphaproteobacteria bacterium]